MKRQHAPFPVAFYALCVCRGFTVSSSALLLVGTRKGTRTAAHDSGVTRIEPELIENCESELQTVSANARACEAGLESIREDSDSETHRYVGSELRHVEELSYRMAALDNARSDIEDARALQDSLHEEVQDGLPSILGFGQIAAVHPEAEAMPQAHLEASIARAQDAALMDQYLKCSSDLADARRAVTACESMTEVLRRNQANHVQQHRTADAHLQSMIDDSDKKLGILDRELSNANADNQRMSAHVDAVNSVTPLTQHR